MIAKNAPEQLDNRLIDIPVLIQPNISRSIALYFADNPKETVAVGVILLGFLIWLAKHFISKGKSDG